MSFKSKKPRPITFPDVPYDELAVSLSLQPEFRDDGVSYSLRFSATPYRTVNGAIEQLDHARFNLRWYNVSADAEDDQALDKAIKLINKAIKDLIDDKEW